MRQDVSDKICESVLQPRRQGAPLLFFRPSLFPTVDINFSIRYVVAYYMHSQFNTFRKNCICRQTEINYIHASSWYRISQQSDSDLLHTLCKEQLVKIRVKGWARNIQCNLHDPYFVLLQWSLMSTFDWKRPFKLYMLIPSQCFQLIIMNETKLLICNSWFLSTMSTRCLHRATHCILGG